MKILVFVLVLNICLLPQVIKPVFINPNEIDNIVNNKIYLLNEIINHNLKINNTYVTQTLAEEIAATDKIIGKNVDYGDINLIVCHSRKVSDSIIINTKIQYLNSGKEILDSIVLVDAGNSYKISYVGHLLPVIISKIIKENNSGKNNDSQGKIQPVIDNLSFHKVPIFKIGGQNINCLNLSLTEQYLNQSLFAINQGLGMAAYWFTGAAPVGNLFISDNFRNRFVYIKDGDNLVINSYGTGTNDYKLNEIGLIDVNVYGEIFVPDIKNKKILKFLYNPNTLSVTPVTPVEFISGYLGKPTKVDYYCGTDYSYRDRTDDRIIVTDEDQNCILIFDYMGTFKARISDYSYQGSVNHISKPRGAILYGYQHPYRIAFIDGGTNSLICGDLPESGTTLNLYSSPSKFEGPSRLIDVGIDGCYNLIVTDIDKDMLHKFNMLGHYSCSYQDNNDFYAPVYVSNLADNYNETSHALQFSLSSSYNENNGCTNYFPGADVINLSNNSSSDGTNTNFTLNFFSTDYIETYIELLNNNQTIRTWTTDCLTSEQKNIIFSQTNMPQGNYKWKIAYRPKYDIYYGQYLVEWKTKELAFTYTIVPPVIANLRQSPAPIYRGGSGNIVCNLSQGNGTLTYNWTAGNLPSGVSASFSGNHATITNNRILTKKDKLFNEKTASAYVQCTVTNSLGAASTLATNIILADAPPSGCPFVYTWDGQVWKEDNNILPQSQYPENLGNDVTDYYQLFTVPKLEDSVYQLAIGEFENERSYLDKAQLLIIDHPASSYVTVDDSGKVIQFFKPAALASADLDSVDVLKQLYYQDQDQAVILPNQTLALTFNDLTSGSDKYLLLLAHVLAKDKVAGKIKGPDKEVYSSFRLRRNNTYQWMKVPIENTTTKEINIQWETDASVDFTQLSNQVELPYTLYAPGLLQASHSVSGDIISKLTAQDNDYAELSPNEWITLKFSAPPLTKGIERSFIFITRGRYERNEDIKNNKNLAKTEEAANVPLKYELFQNYPNPFNSSTIIKYQLKNAGDVKIKLYDILGNLVSVIADGFQKQGVHDINFDASKLSSGIYFYTIKTSEFNATKKLVLIK